MRVTRILKACRNTVRPPKYRVTLEAEPMGLFEWLAVRRAIKNATVPQWLIDEVPLDPVSGRPISSGRG